MPEPKHGTIRILVIPYTPALSHLSRPLAIARELRQRGHEIVFAGSSPKVEFIREAGYPVEELWEPDPDMLFGNIRSGKLRFVPDETIHRMVADDRALFQRIQPDLVLTDGRFSAPISAQMESIPHAAIVNVSSTEYRAVPYVPFFEKIPFARQFLDRVNLWIEMTVFDHGMGLFKKMSREYNLEKTVTATNCLTGADLTLMADIPAYFPARNLPDNYQYIGPLTWKRDVPVAAPSWWDDLRKKRPLIYITMGSTGDLDFFPRVREQILASPCHAVMTTGGQVDGLDSVPGKFHVARFLDGDMVMDACDLVVCHGGNGTVYQALHHATPVIGMPTLPDQSFNMRRVTALGAGTVLPLKQFFSRPELLIETVNEVLEKPAYSRNARSLQGLVNAYAGDRLGADAIEALLRDNGFKKGSGD